MQTRRPLNRIPVRLSHIAETRTNIGPGELYEVGARQMEPYLRTTDLVSQMALEQLLKNKIYTTTNKTDLDFDMIDHSQVMTRTYTIQDKAIFQDTIPTNAPEITSVNWSMKFLCRHKPFATIVDLFYDCERISTEIEAVSVTKEVRE